MQNALHFARCFRCFLLSRDKKWNNWEQQPSWLPKMCSLNADAPQRDIKSNELSSFKAWYNWTACRWSFKLWRYVWHVPTKHGFFFLHLKGVVCLSEEKKRRKKRHGNDFFLNINVQLRRIATICINSLFWVALIATIGAGQLKQMMLISFQDVSSSPK